MPTKSAEKLWKMYPEGRLHCEVTKIDVGVYKLVTSMLDRDNNMVGSIEHTGSGDLARLKEEALQKLIGELEQRVK